MDNVDEAEGEMRMRMIDNKEDIQLLYTNLFNLNTPFDLISLFFAIFLIIFGFIGYFRTGSLISLIASVGISIPIIIGAYLTVKLNFYWSILTLVSTIILFIMMASRYYKSLAFYPSGLVSLISFIVLSFLTTRIVFYFYKNRN